MKQLRKIYVRQKTKAAIIGKDFSKSMQNIINAHEKIASENKQLQIKIDELIIEKHMLKERIMHLEKTYEKEIPFEFKR